VRLLVVLALLFAITPGVSEVIEEMMEQAADDSSGDACGGRRCIPFAHDCNCYPTISPPATSRQGVIATVSTVDPMGIAIVSGRACEPPPLRPPIV
jgi:hypothetical protein